MCVYIYRDLCPSTDENHFKVRQEQQYVLDDVKADDGSLLTDGCGMIRQSLAVQICQKLGIPEDTTGRLHGYADRSVPRSYFCQYFRYGLVESRCV